MELAVGALKQAERNTGIKITLLTETILFLVVVLNPLAHGTSVAVFRTNLKRAFNKE